jgi:hypothetical protein
VRASSVTDYTQTNWNGIIGRIELMRGPAPRPNPPPPHSAQLRTRGTQFVVGNTPILLKGTLECANFPLTGHPPMDYESWWRIFRIAADNGLNHIRFHSWCPPEAAFEAARLRFRPIVMTSLAFVLGVLPLVLAGGAGAGARRSMGTGVFGGMIAATFIATVFIPLFFVVLSRAKIRAPDDAPVIVGESTA